MTPVNNELLTAFLINDTRHSGTTNSVQTLNNERQDITATEWKTFILITHGNASG